MFVALLLAASYLPSEACDTAARVQEIHAVQKRLFAIPEPADGMLPIDTPQAATAEVPALRVALSAAIASYMNCDAGTLREPAVLENRLASLLGGKSAPPGLPPGTEYPITSEASDDVISHIYGDSLTIAVQDAAGMPGTLVVDVSFGIACGDDHVLMAFTRSDEGWQRVLEWKSDQYKDPSDAFGDFFAYAAVPGPDDKPLFLVAHGDPWCTSRMSGFKVDLIQPGTPQRLLQHEEREYSRGEHQPGFQPRAYGATLLADVDGNDFDTRMTFAARVRYRTTEGKLTRLPEANSPLDFVDQWLGENWKVAAEWSVRPDAALEAIHAEDGNGFQAAQQKKEQQAEVDNPSSSPSSDAPAEKDTDYDTFAFGSVHACRAAKGAAPLPHLFQVELDRDGMKHGEETHKEAFLIVEQSGSMYRVRALKKAPDPACDGPDLNKKE